MMSSRRGQCRGLQTAPFSPVVGSSQAQEQVQLVPCLEASQDCQVGTSLGGTEVTLTHARWVLAAMFLPASVISLLVRPKHE